MMATTMGAEPWESEDRAEGSSVRERRFSIRATASPGELQAHRPERKLELDPQRAMEPAVREQERVVRRGREKFHCVAGCVG